jgi:glycosyltransferase
MNISVVTVCRNAGATIGYTLESFFKQNHAEKELIVVDGLSTDDTLDIVRSFQSQGLLLISEADRGIYDAMNKGLRAFAGDAVGFLNADDQFKTDDALTAIAGMLRDNDLVYGDLDVVAQPSGGRVDFGGVGCPRTRPSTAAVAWWRRSGCSTSATAWRRTMTSCFARSSCMTSGRL